MNDPNFRAFTVCVAWIILLAGCSSFAPPRAEGPIKWTQIIGGPAGPVLCPGPADDVVVTKTAAGVDLNALTKQYRISGSVEEVYQSIRPHVKSEVTQVLVSLALMCRAYAGGMLELEQYKKFYSDAAAKISDLGSAAGPKASSPSVAVDKKLETEVLNQVFGIGIFRKNLFIKYFIWEEAPGKISITTTGNSEIINVLPNPAIYRPSIKYGKSISRRPAIYIGEHNNVLSGCHSVSLDNVGSTIYQCPPHVIPPGGTLQITQTVDYEKIPISSHVIFSDPDVTILPVLDDTKITVAVSRELKDKLCVKIFPMFVDNPLATRISRSDYVEASTRHIDLKVKGLLLPYQGFFLEIMQKQTGNRESSC